SVFDQRGLVAEFCNVAREHDAVHAVIVHDQQRAGWGGWRLFGCGCFPMHLGHFISATSQLLRLYRCEHRCEDEGEKDRIKKTSTDNCPTEDDEICEQSVYGGAVLMWRLSHHKVESFSRNKS